MAISTPDSLIAGAKAGQMFMKALSGTLVAGRPHSYFYTAGIPGPAAAPSSGVNGAALTSYAGQIPFSNPVSGETRLARLVGWASQTGMLLVCDRLWHNSGLSVTSTSAQSITFPTLPARDVNGATNGDGVLIGMEVTTATGTGTNVPTIGYTDSAGNAGASSGLAFTYVASSIAGSFYPFALAAGDVGVRSVGSFTNSVSMTSGAISLVAYRVLASIEIGVSGGQAGPFELMLPKMYDNTIPFLLFVPNTTTSSYLNGMVTVVQG